MELFCYNQQFFGLFFVLFWNLPQEDIEEIIQKINSNEEVINESKRPRRQAAIKATGLRKRLLDEDAL